MCRVDLEKELSNLATQAPEGEEARNGERLIQFASESLVTEVLIQPQTSTLVQCARNLLSSFTRHRHVIHAGYTFAGNGSWALQDGTFSVSDFLDALQEPEAQRVVRAYDNSVSIDIHCSPEGDWNTARLNKEACARGCNLRINPDDCLPAGTSAITSFIDYISYFIKPAGVEQLLEPSDVVGNIRFSHPTLYVFPGGQGDAALFGINGFNMLVDGGYSRKSCFWDFTRHLDRLDAVMITRINNSNMNGIASVLKRKRLGHVYPQIGHFFCNVVERKTLFSPDSDKNHDALLIDLLEEGHELVSNLQHLELKPHACYREATVEPINLYHKVGHGKLDMYVLSPSRDSKDVKEFLTKWNASDKKLFSSKTDKTDLKFPLQNLMSICALLVWQPANPTDTITRILFPGSTPQHKIFEGLEKLKHLDFLKQPVCTAKSLQPLSLKTKTKLLEKITPDVKSLSLKATNTKLENRTNSTETKQPKSVVSIEKSGKSNQQVPPQSPSKVSGKVEKVARTPKIESKIEQENDKLIIKSDKVKTEVKIKTEHKSKVDSKSSAPKSRTDAKATTRSSTERKVQRTHSSEKRSEKTSPPTPKKTDLKTKLEIKSDTKSLTQSKIKSRISPTATPAKSAKEANNRKVVESKIQATKVGTSRATNKKSIPESTSNVSKGSERKPISRRVKAASPSKGPKTPTSPTKTSSIKSTPPQSVKSENEGVAMQDKVLILSNVETEVQQNESSASTPSTAEVTKLPLQSETDTNNENEILEETELSNEVVETEDKHSLDDEIPIVEVSEKDILEAADVCIKDEENVINNDIKEEQQDDVEEEDDETKNEEVEEKIDEEGEDIKEDDGKETISFIDSQLEEVTEDDVELDKRLNETDDRVSDNELDTKDADLEIEEDILTDEAEDKHIRDEEESEKERKKKDIDEEKEEEQNILEATGKIVSEKPMTDTKDLEYKDKLVIEGKFDYNEPTTSDNKTIDDDAETDVISAENKQNIEVQVKDIITTAQNVVAIQKESNNVNTELDVRNESTESEEKMDMSSEKNKEEVSPEDDRKELKLGEEGTNTKSQPEERVSAMETSATTAPSMPEDERIPLDEIKEVVEEKYTKEETKEKDLQNMECKSKHPITPKLPEIVASIPFDQRANVHSQRDIVKTPDEVADLPVHEEVDGALYDNFECMKTESKKEDAVKQNIVENIQQLDIHKSEPNKDKMKDLEKNYDLEEVDKTKSPVKIEVVKNTSDTQIESKSFQVADEHEVNNIENLNEKQDYLIDPKATNMDSELLSTSCKIEDPLEINMTNNTKITEELVNTIDEMESQVFTKNTEIANNDTEDKMTTKSDNFGIAVSSDSTNDKEKESEKINQEILPEVELTEKIKIQLTNTESDPNNKNTKYEIENKLIEDSELDKQKENDSFLQANEVKLDDDTILEKADVIECILDVKECESIETEACITSHDGINVNFNEMNNKTLEDAEENKSEDVNHEDPEALENNPISCTNVTPINNDITMGANVTIDFDEYESGSTPTKIEQSEGMSDILTDNKEIKYDNTETNDSATKEEAHFSTNLSNKIETNVSPVCEAEEEITNKVIEKITTEIELPNSSLIQNIEVEYIENIDKVANIEISKNSQDLPDCHSKLSETKEITIQERFLCKNVNLDSLKETSENIIPFISEESESSPAVNMEIIEDEEVCATEPCTNVGEDNYILSDNMNLIENDNMVHEKEIAIHLTESQTPETEIKKLNSDENEKTIASSNSFEEINSKDFNFDKSVESDVPNVLNLEASLEEKELSITSETKDPVKKFNICDLDSSNNIITSTENDSKTSVVVLETNEISTVEENIVSESENIVSCETANTNLDTLSDPSHVDSDIADKTVNENESIYDTNISDPECIAAHFEAISIIDKDKNQLEEQNLESFNMNICKNETIMTPHVSETQDSKTASTQESTSIESDAATTSFQNLNIAAECPTKSTDEILENKDIKIQQAESSANTSRDILKKSEISMEEENVVPETTNEVVSCETLNTNLGALSELSPGDSNFADNTVNKNEPIDDTNFCEPECIVADSEVILIIDNITHQFEEQNSESLNMNICKNVTSMTPLVSESQESETALTQESTSIESNAATKSFENLNITGEILTYITDNILENKEIKIQQAESSANADTKTFGTQDVIATEADNELTVSITNEDNVKLSETDETCDKILFQLDVKHDLALNNIAKGENTKPKSKEMAKIVTDNIDKETASTKKNLEKVESMILSNDTIQRKLENEETTLLKNNFVEDDECKVTVKNDISSESAIALKPENDVLEDSSSLVLKTKDNNDDDDLCVNKSSSINSNVQPTNIEINSDKFDIKSGNFYSEVTTNVSNVKTEKEEKHLENVKPDPTLEKQYEDSGSYSAIVTTSKEVDVPTENVAVDSSTEIVSDTTQKENTKVIETESVNTIDSECETNVSDPLTASYLEIIEQLQDNVSDSVCTINSKNESEIIDCSSNIISNDKICVVEKAASPIEITQVGTVNDSLAKTGLDMDNANPINQNEKLITSNYTQDAQENLSAPTENNELCVVDLPANPKDIIHDLEVDDSLVEASLDMKNEDSHNEYDDTITSNYTLEKQDITTTPTAKINKVDSKLIADERTDKNIIFSENSSTGDCHIDTEISVISTNVTKILEISSGPLVSEKDEKFTDNLSDEKNSYSSTENIKEESKIFDLQDFELISKDNVTSISSQHRVMLTASSEDGGDETELDTSINLKSQSMDVSNNLIEQPLDQDINNKISDLQKSVIDTTSSNIDTNIYYTSNDARNEISMKLLESVIVPTETNDDKITYTIPEKKKDDVSNSIQSSLYCKESINVDTNFKKSGEQPEIDLQPESTISHNKELDDQENDQSDTLESIVTATSTILTMDTSDHIVEKENNFVALEDNALIETTDKNLETLPDLSLQNTCEDNNISVEQNDLKSEIVEFSNIEQSSNFPTSSDPSYISVTNNVTSSSTETAMPLKDCSMADNACNNITKDSIETEMLLTKEISFEISDKDTPRRQEQKSVQVTSTENKIDNMCIISQIKTLSESSVGQNISSTTEICKTDQKAKCEEISEITVLSTAAEQLMVQNGSLFQENVADESLVITQTKEDSQTEYVHSSDKIEVYQQSWSTEFNNTNGTTNTSEKIESNSIQLMSHMGEINSTKEIQSISSQIKPSVTSEKNIIDNFDNKNLVECNIQLNTQHEKKELLCLSGFYSSVGTYLDPNNLLYSSSAISLHTNYPSYGDIKYTNTPTGSEVEKDNIDSKVIDAVDNVELQQSANTSLRVKTPISDISDHEIALVTPFSDVSIDQAKPTHTLDDERPDSKQSNHSGRDSTSPHGSSSQSHFGYEKTANQDQSAMTSSFYGNLPDDDDAIVEHISQAKKVSQGVRTEPTGPYQYAEDSYREEEEDMYHHFKAQPEYKTDEKMISLTSESKPTANVSSCEQEKYLDNYDNGNAAAASSSQSNKDVINNTKQLPSTSESREVEYTLPSVGTIPKGTTIKPSDTKDSIEGWGKPLGLPAPAPPMTHLSPKGTPKKEKKYIANRKSAERVKDGKIIKDNNAAKQKTLGSPMYFDLTYVPHHGNSHYTQVEFFKKVRARYYVFSGTEPSRDVYSSLLEAKQTWDDKDLEVTIIPTYDTDTLGYWVAENEEALSQQKIDLSPSASRCTINLQDHETSCSAYRLEF